jgi:pre-mRNA-splicing factor 38B
LTFEKEPNIPGHPHIPSTAYCLLYKCFTLRLTFKQVSSMLGSKKSSFIRALGFLYLRYGCEAEKLWEWFEPYIDDTEEFVPGTDGAKV